MKNETKNPYKPSKKNELILFSGNEAVEDLIYGFLKDRSPLTEQAYCEVE
jgi:hypothetical protein